MRFVSWELCVSSNLFEHMDVGYQFQVPMTMAATCWGSRLSRAWAFLTRSCAIWKELHLEMISTCHFVKFPLEDTVSFVSPRAVQAENQYVVFSTTEAK